MASIEAVSKTPQTLAERLGQGRLPARDALRYALLLTEALRRIHESGVVHGGLTPACVNLTPQGIELVPSRGRTVTPYTAPEVLLGKPAGTRADIYSLGAIVLELTTGQPPTAKGGPVSTGNTALDRVLGPCLAVDPAVRCPRAQRVLLELKLLVIALRKRARESPVSPVEAQLRAFEARMTARLDSIDRAIHDIRETLRRLERNGGL
jgi:serine/threonine protein kinase